MAVPVHVTIAVREPRMLLVRFLPGIPDAFRVLRVQYLSPSAPVRLFSADSGHLSPELIHVRTHIAQVMPEDSDGRRRAKRPEYFFTLFYAFFRLQPLADVLIQGKYASYFPIKNERYPMDLNVNASAILALAFQGLAYRFLLACVLEQSAGFAEKVSRRYKRVQQLAFAFLRGVAEQFVKRRVGDFDSPAQVLRHNRQRAAGNQCVQEPGSLVQAVLRASPLGYFQFQFGGSRHHSHLQRVSGLG